VVFAALVVIAIAFLAWRVADREPAANPTRREAPGAAPRVESTPTPESARAENPSFEPGVIGLDYKEVIEALEDKAGDFEYDTVFLLGEDLVVFLSQNGVDEEDADEGEVVGTDPPPEVPFTDGETITLYVSAGLEDSDDDEHGRGKGRGHDKKDSQQEEDD
jgi:hypothetical protein